jgi:hypothetical protein
MAYSNSTNNININTPIRSVAASATAALTDYIIEVTSVAAARTITLPAPSSSGSTSTVGKVYIVKNTSGATTNPITITPTSGTIDGAASLSIATAYGSYIVYSDGTSWYSEAGASNLTFPVSVPNGGTGDSTLTNHAVLLGQGTSPVAFVGPTATSGQVLQSAGSSADPAFSTATYPSTTTLSQLLYSSATNTVGGLATANSASLVTNSTGVPAWSSTMTNGQMIIGSTGATPVSATLTAGVGIFVTNGAGSVTVASMPYTSITANQTLAVSNGYFVTSGALSLALPATSAVGDKIELILTAGTSWTITQASGQQIVIGNQSTTLGAGGSLASTATGDAVSLVCSAANTIWYVRSSMGNITVT